MDPDQEFGLKRERAWRGVPRNAARLTARDMNLVASFLRETKSDDPAQTAALEARLQTRLPVGTRSPPRENSAPPVTAADEDTSEESGSEGVSSNVVVDAQEQAPKSSQSPNNGDEVPRLDSSSSAQSTPYVSLDSGNDDDEMSPMFLPPCSPPCSTPWSVELASTLEQEVEATLDQAHEILERAAETLEAERAAKAEQHEFEALFYWGPK
jgi:hypothetical protein